MELGKSDRTQHCMGIKGGSWSLERELVEHSTDILQQGNRSEISGN